MLIQSISQPNRSLYNSISKNEQQILLQRLKEYELQQLQSNSERLKKLQAINQVHKEKLIQAIGEEKMNRLSSFLNNLKQSKADVLLPPGNAKDAYDKWKKIHQSHKEKADEFLQAEGIDRSKLKEVNMSTKSLYDEMLPTTPILDGRPVTILMPDELAWLDDGSPSGNATQAAPPYDFGLALSDFQEHTGGNFESIPTFAVNENTGFIGGSSNLVNRDASNLDIGIIEFNTSIGIFYQMPATGLLEVWIEAQSGLSKHQLDLDDEFGFSGALVSQQHYFALTAFSATQTSDLSRCEISRFDIADEVDGFWNTTPLVAGNSYWAHLFSTVPFEEGSTIMILVGTNNFHLCAANDVKIDSNMQFNWFFKSVWLDSTGTP